MNSQTSLNKLYEIHNLLKRKNILVKRLASVQSSCQQEIATIERTISEHAQSVGIIQPLVVSCRRTTRIAPPAPRVITVAGGRRTGAGRPAFMPLVIKTAIEQAGGPITINQIAESTGKNYQTVRKVLLREIGTFVKKGRGWTLVKA